MSKHKLYLDEDVDPLLSKILRERGYDVTSATGVRMKTLSDYEQIEFAISEGRTILTHNIKHFVELSKEYVATGKIHFGIIVSNQLPLKELLKRLLKLLNNRNPENLYNNLHWLHDYK